MISQGPGTPSIGMKPTAGPLYVAGGRPAPAGWSTPARTGARLVPTPVHRRGATAFVNDVVLTQRCLVHRLPQRRALRHPTRPGTATAPGAASSPLPLTGDWTQTAGLNNANGIAPTPDGRGLLVVQSSTGFLFRVDPRTGVARQIDLGGTL